MKLQRLILQNWGPHAALDLDMTASPINVVCGPNRIGKSMIAEAVEFCLRGECARLLTKGMRPAFVTDGQRKGRVELHVGNAGIARDISTGKHSIPFGDIGAEGIKPDLLPLLADHQRVIGMPADDLRRVLYLALSVGTGQDAIAQELLARGHDAARVEAIRADLQKSTDHAAKAAQANATQARGAWKAVTGESYGSLKADGWQPDDVPVVTDDELRDAAAAVEQLDAEHQQAQQRIGQLRQQRDSADAQGMRRQQLQERADLLARRRTKLANDQADLQHWAHQLEAAEEAAQHCVDGSPDLIHGLAYVVSELTKVSPSDYAASLLIQYRAKHGEPKKPADEPSAELVELARSAPKLREIVASRSRAVENDSRDIADSEAAAAELSSMEAMQRPTDDDVSAAADAANQLRQSLASARARLESLRDARAAADSRVSRIATAAEHHADVAAWSAIADDLQPSGIPAQQLASALDPLNQRLLQSASATGWPIVQVLADMTVAMGGRPAVMESESGRWRAGLMLTESIMHLSGQRCLIVDRFDVLDLPSRGQCMKWLGGLAAAGELDSALILGTLKEPPKLPAGFGVHWIGGAQ